jgi:anaerobic dimethyl sulfoxide reductase subunit A
MAKLLERIEESGINRRQFVGLAATVGAVATLGLTGCENKVKETGPSDPTPDKLTGGEWMTFRCPISGCTTTCVNQAYVVDGTIIRQRTDETIEDSVDNPQVRGCIKGRSQRWYVTAPDRLKYPMKRKNWMPGGGENVNGHLRGIDEWERISWDEAIAYIAEEFKRIADTYGPRAFLGLGKGAAGARIFNLLGGCLTTYGEQTPGGSEIVRAYIGNNLGNSMDRMALRHTKLMVLFGNNTAWMQQNQIYTFINSKKAAGTKVVIIDPWFTPTAQVVADQWIPIHPSTDGALIEALVHELITNNWVDQEFLDKYTVGFDAEHMPADAKTNENYKDYILGAYDGIPKTAEWASPITGIPVETIKDLAKDMGSTKPMYIKSSTSLCRTYYGNRTCHQVAALSWICGCMGELGASYVYGSPHGVFNRDQDIVRGSAKTPAIVKNAICTPPGAGGMLTGFAEYDPNQEYGISYPEIFKAVATGEYTLPGQAHEKRACDIKCMYNEGNGNAANQMTGAQYVAEAHRKVDFVLYQDFQLKSGLVYADIVLPAKTSFEIDFIQIGNVHSCLYLTGKNILAPYYESKDDNEIFYLLCDALGFGEDVVPRQTTEQGYFNMLASTTIPVDGGDPIPLVSITAEDLEFYGMKGEPQEGHIPLREYKEDNMGIFHLDRKPDDFLTKVPQKAFITDPVANPMKTTSGKLEIYCQALKDHYDRCSYHDIDALPKYKPAVGGYEEVSKDPEYKYMLINVHHLRQVQSNYSTNKVLTELFANDLMMSSYDAKKDGFKNGDWVLVTGKDAGQIVRRLCVTPYVAPGVILLGQANWLDVDDKSGIDFGGCTSYLKAPQLLGDGYQAYNTNPLKIEKYTGQAPLPDHLKPYVVPIAE